MGVVERGRINDTWFIPFCVDHPHAVRTPFRLLQTIHQTPQIDDNTPARGGIFMYNVCWVGGLEEAKRGARNTME